MHYSWEGMQSHHLIDNILKKKKKKKHFNLLFVIVLISIFFSSIVGTIVIIFGLYTTLWGKRKEKEKKLMENTNFEQGTESKLENQ